MAELAALDDALHPPASDDRWWSETYWFSFDQPERGLSGTFYPLFRPNLGVASLAVAIWDASAGSPWELCYHRCLWHLAIPEQPADGILLEGLRYTVREPLQRYRVQYADGDLLRADLEYEGLVPPHAARLEEGRGHLDQPCRVRGELVLAGETIAIDAFAMRDRSWGPRPDDRSARAAYTYAIASGDESFLAVSMPLPEDERVVAGFLVREGEKAPIVEGVRRATRSSQGWPDEVVIEARDTLGRALAARGRTRNRIANQATPGMFSWMSLTEWDFAGTSFGEDQEVWSPDRLVRPARAR